MPVAQFALPYRPAWDSNGKIIPGALLWFTLAGTNTPATVYSDEPMAEPMANPVVANQAGRFAAIYFDEEVPLRVRLYEGDATVGVDTPIEEYDPYGPIAIPAPDNTFTQTGSGAETVPASVKMEQHLDVRDYLPGGAWDGSTDSTVRVQQAIDEAGARNATLHMAPGIKFGAVTIDAPCKISGEGGKGVVTAAAGNYDTFTINSDDVYIEHLRFNDIAKSGGVTINEVCGTGSIQRLHYKDILTYDSFGFLKQTGSVNGSVITQHITEVQALRLRGPGIVATRLLAHGFWSRVTMEFLGVAASDFTAFKVDGSGLSEIGFAGGLTIDDCNAAGTASSFANPNQVGFDFKDYSDIQLWARADGMGGDGFRYDGCDKMVRTSAHAAQCMGVGHKLTDVTNSIFTGMFHEGRGPLGGTVGMDGVQFVSGCFNVMIGNLLSRGSTRHGVHKMAAQTGIITIGNLQSGLSQAVNGVGDSVVDGCGVKSVGTSPFLVGSAALIGNTVNYDLGGTTDYLRSVMLNSGTVVDAGPGPVSA